MAEYIMLSEFNKITRFNREVSIGDARYFPNVFTVRLDFSQDHTKVLRLMS